MAKEWIEDILLLYKERIIAKYPLDNKAKKISLFEFLKYTPRSTI